MRRTAVAVLPACLLLAACGAKEVELRTAAPTPSPTAAAATPSPSAPSSPARTAGSPASARDESPASTAASTSSPAASKPPADAPQPDYGAPLWSTSWRAVERTRGGEPWPFVDNWEWEVGFETGSRSVMRWNACNYTGSHVVVTADRLLVDGPEGSTAIGCDADGTTEDRQAAAFFTSDPTWRRSGSTLLLTSGETVVRLIRAEG